MIYKKILKILLVVLLVNLFSCEQSEKVLLVCVNKYNDFGYSIENDYQLYSLQNIKNFIDTSGCIDYDNWLDEELFYRIRNNQFYNSLLNSVDIEPFNFNKVNNDGHENERFLLIKSGMDRENNKLSIIDINRVNRGLQFMKIDLEVDSTCFPKLVDIQHIDISPIDCIKIVKKEEGEILEEKWTEFWQISYETDFMNTMYFDRGAIAFCTGYSYYIAYNSASTITDGKREFYRECPGVKSPIYLVSEKVIEIVKN